MSSFSEANKCADYLTEKEQSDLLKEEGNVFFKAFNYNKAIEKYSAAIAIYPDAVYYSNRAQCHIKNEDFGLAIADATEAISLNPSSEKAFFRRGSAYFGLNDYTAAKKDFQSILVLQPTNNEAKNKVRECDKFIKQKQFLEAMHVEVQPPIDRTSVDKIPIESSYTGPKLESESGEFLITPALVIELMNHFKDQKKSSQKIYVEAADSFCQTNVRARYSSSR